MQLKVGIVEGWSAPLDFDLLNDGSAEDLTGMTVTGVAYNRLGIAVTLTGDVSVVTATAGRVRLTPDTDDFNREGSPYDLRFRVEDGSGLFAFFPSDEAVSLIVRR